MTRKEIRDFISKAEETSFDGCYYLWTNRDTGYALVFAYDDKKTLLGKIARNTDDLQCDYDWDWEADSPDDEIYDCKNESLEYLTDFFYSLALQKGMM